MEIDMDQEPLHEALRPHLHNGGIFVALLGVFAAVLLMTMLAYRYDSWILVFSVPLPYAVIMTLGCKRLWSIYRRILPNHTLADVKVFNNWVSRLIATNSFVMMAALGMLIWLPH